MNFTKSLFFAEKSAISKFLARAIVRQAARQHLKNFETYSFDQLSPKKISKHFEPFKVVIFQFPIPVCFRLVKAVGADSQNSP